MALYSLIVLMCHYESTHSLDECNMNVLKGFAAHVSPFTSAQDLGGLLNRTGFALLTLVCVSSRRCLMWLHSSWLVYILLLIYC